MEMDSSCCCFSCTLMIGLCGVGVLLLMQQVVVSASFLVSTMERLAKCTTLRTVVVGCCFFSVGSCFLSTVLRSDFIPRA